MAGVSNNGRRHEGKDELSDRPPLARSDDCHLRDEMMQGTRLHTVDHNTHLIQELGVPSSSVISTISTNDNGNQCRGSYTLFLRTLTINNHPKYKNTPIYL